MAKNKNVVSREIVEAAIDADNQRMNGVIEMSQEQINEAFESFKVEAKNVGNADTTNRNQVGELALQAIDMVTLARLGSIGFANTLLQELKYDRRKAVLDFFQTFIPYKYDNAKGQFVSMFNRNSTAYKRKYDAARAFRADGKNNLWDWWQKKQNVKRGNDPKNTPAQRVTRAIQSAMRGKGKDKTGALSPFEVMDAVFAAQVGTADIEAWLKREMKRAKKALRKAEKKAAANAKAKKDAAKGK